jgi:hypothetical protein
MKMDYNACFTIIYTQQINHLLKKVRKNNKVKAPTLLLFWLLWMKLREHVRQWRVGPPVGVSWLAGHESLTPPVGTNNCSPLLLLALKQ